MFNPNLMLTSTKACNSDFQHVTTTKTKKPPHHLGTPTLKVGSSTQDMRDQHSSLDHHQYIKLFTFK